MSALQHDRANLSPKTVKRIPDELTWLRELERAVRDIRSTDKYSEQMLCVSEVQSRINQRIVGLLETQQRPCNEMGGGSAGLDTADDFAMHCGKPDRHDGPHSYEENQCQ